MKFYQDEKKAVVWNSTPRIIAAEFVGGEFETEDKELQERLKDMGYRFDAPKRGRKSTTDGSDSD